ncbi:peroxisomal nicotinamide adenine dinucleotide carrier-like isoform X1 [Mangifera indica]|uniref:peroxisomal nicotinamide adenine dinucleotide carrier-like isoform X1 n=1 Tax=Mangifera indica TaxID=29780 RepID=UPI001CFA4DEB|nr:peroxisomal nicotinamide adenine dinucleotide carrier-like isoform X1 [Mangifera indica]
MSDALINGLAGAGAGIIAQLITYPLQTVNTRQQTERDLSKEKRRLGTIEQMCQVVKHEGWERLYGGLTPSLVGTAASQGVYYYFYQIFRNKAEAKALEHKRKGVGDGSVGMFSSLVVAALAGCVNVLLTNPIWVVVTRMQTHTKILKKSQLSQAEAVTPDEVIPAALEPPPYGTSHVIQEIYGEAGLWGFWKGVFPTLIMVSEYLLLCVTGATLTVSHYFLQVSNPSIQFMLYETMLKKLKKRRSLSKKDGIRVTASEIFLLGALAKLGATVVTYPLLVVKSRLQAKQVRTGDKRHHYKGTMDAILKMIRYEGFNGFYKGMSTKIVQSVLAAAVLFMMKEELVKGTRFLLTKDRRLDQGL